MQHLTSRKFIVTVLSLMTSSVLCWFGRIADGVYATVVVATVSAYMTANWAVNNKAEKVAP